MPDYIMFVRPFPPAPRIILRLGGEISWQAGSAANYPAGSTGKKSQIFADWAGTLQIPFASLLNPYALHGEAGQTNMNMTWKSDRPQFLAACFVRGETNGMELRSSLASMQLSLARPLARSFPPSLPSSPGRRET